MNDKYHLMRTFNQETSVTSPILRNIKPIVLNFSIFPKMQCLHEAEYGLSDKKITTTVNKLIQMPLHIYQHCKTLRCKF